MRPDLAFAEFIDRCCWRYVKHAGYRRTLEAERPNTKPTTRTRKGRAKS